MQNSTIAPNAIGQKYSSEVVRTLELLLDPANPRIIEALAEPTQEKIRAHLLKYEKVVSLANEIVDYGGLMPGERIIVTRENGSMVVLEGNRRVCACQLLLDRSLVPKGYRIPVASNEVLKSISRLEVDVVSSRNAAAWILASRHIEGIRKWETLAKWRFYVKRFESGQNIAEISEITRTAESKVREDIQHYYLLELAIGLLVADPDKVISTIDWHEIDPSVFVRVFHARDSILKQNLLKKMELRFDEKTLRPKSTLPQPVFEKALKLIARAAFVEKKISTRSTASDVPGLVDLLECRNHPASHGASPCSPTSDTVSGVQRKIRIPAEPISTSTELTGTAEPSSPPAAERAATSPPIHKPLGFFENLVCNVNPADPDSAGIRAIAREIREISTKKDLERFPNAAGMLMRALVEQALKYHLKKGTWWSDFLATCRSDPSLSSLVKYCRAHLKELFDRNTQRVFKAVFDNPGIKESLDLVIHQPHLTTMTPEVLVGIAKVGMFSLIQSLLG